MSKYNTEFLFKDAQCEILYFVFLNTVWSYIKFCLLEHLNRDEDDDPFYTTYLRVMICGEWLDFWWTELEDNPTAEE